MTPGTYTAELTLGLVSLIGVPTLVLLVVLVATHEHGRQLRDARRREARERRRNARELDRELGRVLELDRWRS